MNDDKIPMTDDKIPMTPIQLRIFKTLSKGESLTRKQLVQTLETARTTIFDNLVKLQKLKLVLKYSKNDGLRGRPIILWYIPKRILKQLKYR